MSRSYMSGAAKRKLVKAKELQTKKMAGNMARFLSSSMQTNIEVDPDSADSCSSKFCSIENVPPDIIDAEESRTNVVDYADLKDVQFKPSNSMDVSNSATKFEQDPAKWTVITDTMIEFFIKNPPPQNIDKVGETERVISGGKRFLTKNHFFMTKKNNEKVAREWLVLSCSNKSLYCWICKLFCSTSSTSLSTSGFNDWKHVAVRLAEHENSSLHRESALKMSIRLQTSSRVDSNIVVQYQNEVNYWRSVLKRVVACVKFLSMRGLAFFGDNETVGSVSNGNFLGCMELISEFDPFLAGHLQKYSNQGSGITNYLSSTCLTEFIQLMAEKVCSEVLAEITHAKYFSLIVDSTPDITHLDQLCIVLRYVGKDCEPKERFVKFIPVFGHSAETLTEAILKMLEELGIDLENCRGQSYDNAKNMSGKYTGVQTRIKELNPLAEFVPCSGHFLNLVGANAAESSNAAVNYFGIVQELYNFFSASTNRWQALNKNMDKKKKFTHKSRSETRWCADAECTKALRKNYKEIVKTLEELSQSEDATPATKHEAGSLYKKLMKLETVINTVVWDTILQKLNSTSTILQSSSANIAIISPLYESLMKHIQNVRDNFDEYEKEAKSLLPSAVAYSQIRRKRIPKSRLLDDSSTPQVDLSVREHFIVNCHYTICDVLLANLKFRKEPYDNILQKFACITSSDKKCKNAEAKALQEIYSIDLGEEFVDELCQFNSIISENETVNDMLKKVKTYNLSSAFCNVETALRIFLTIPISNCSGERSFSLLKRLKSPLRSYLLQNKLTQLSLLCLNSDVTSKLSYDDIDLFANSKARKRPLQTKIS